MQPEDHAATGLSIFRADFATPPRTADLPTVRTLDD
jgi:hypothetical protein